jgi:16S rRNA (guanine(966)-N(2))-methyltransferase RsmD
MRVIGGAARGRRLKVPKGKAVRPTAARVKESLFNILPRDFSGVRVLDLFAGSGNVSIEALSRGAEKTILIDESARSAAVIRDNLRRLGLTERAEVWTVPVIRGLKKLAKAGQRFEMIFLDPPYNRGWVEASLKALARCDLLSESGTVVAEHSLHETVMPRYGNLVLNDQRRYGDTLLSFFKRDLILNSVARG